MFSRPFSALLFALFCLVPASSLGLDIEAPWIAFHGPQLVEAGTDQLIEVYVNTTEDLPVVSEHCLPGELCPLRSAIEALEGRGLQGVVRACYDPGQTPDGKACPPGRTPLSTDDVGYDFDTGKWTFEIAESFPAYTFSANGTTIDFTLDVVGWDGPEDNKILISPGVNLMDHIFIVESGGNTFKGFEIRGEVGIAAMVLREGLLGEGATTNQIGPGLIFSAITPGVGILIRDQKSSGNIIEGNWCGITGDGTEEMPLQDDCIQIAFRASRNTIGGSGPGSRNVMAASSIGSGVSIQEAAHGNSIRGNWIGLNAVGEPVGNNGGVIIKLNSHDTVVEDNVISGNQLTGVSIYGDSYRTRIRENMIGLRDDGETCAGNGDVGITINNGVSESLVERNVIACNDKGGISISGASATSNTLSQNSISRHPSGGAIRVSQGANRGVSAPKISSGTKERIIGSAASCKNGTVEIYTDTNGEAAYFEGETTANGATGLFLFTATEPLKYALATVLCTDTNGNSSSLSSPYELLEKQPTPVPTPTEDPNSGPVLADVFIPAIMKSYEPGR